MVDLMGGHLAVGRGASGCFHQRGAHCHLPALELHLLGWQPFLLGLSLLCLLLPDLLELLEVQDGYDFAFNPSGLEEAFAEEVVHGLVGIAQRDFIPLLRLLELIQLLELALDVGGAGCLLQLRFSNLGLGAPPGSAGLEGQGAVAFHHYWKKA